MGIDNKNKISFLQYIKTMCALTGFLRYGR